MNTARVPPSRFVKEVSEDVRPELDFFIKLPAVSENRFLDDDWNAIANNANRVLKVGVTTVLAIDDLDVLPNAAI